MALDVKPLTPETWEAYADLIARNGGVWGGCWCMGFHPESFHGSPEANRAAKEARVRAGTAHAALVFEGERRLGWCQCGPAIDLTRIEHRKAWETGGGCCRIGGSPAFTLTRRRGGGGRPGRWRGPWG